MKVIITDCDHVSIKIERQVLEVAGVEVELKQCRTEEDLIDQCKSADALINQYAPLTRKVMENLPNLKVLSRYGVGLDNVDVKAATDLGIQVCNVPDYGVEEVSDHALALVFSLLRKIPQLNKSVKEGKWDLNPHMPIRRIRDLTVGVVGLGRIGQAFARKGIGMGWNVIGYDYSHSESKIAGLEIVDFETLLAKSDVISIHVPLTSETKNLFADSAFSKMKDGSMLINTARGSIVNEDALLRALQSKKLSGAALDVMSQEPPQLKHPLLNYEQFIVTPHSAWYSVEAEQDLKRKAAEEVLSYLHKGEVRYPANCILNTGGKANV
ncbi:phosphoglycerate dehydrogenase family protein [Priestia megaterium]|nr:C-terminal binding protein [Priestia megaterium]PFI60694.1 phosphoglycerate dehydrogenase family protein [Priestia megaterium]PFT51715.1 phosphoglycerate dehydrogenase family protein [Priestia megaterium]PFV93135.1 phosphoglycerate dehydrogenase family protein [Priestia megaterium]